jgi:hypothetical protein
MIVIAAMITTFNDQGDAYQKSFKELAAKVRKDPRCNFLCSSSYDK